MPQSSGCRLKPVGTPSTVSHLVTAKSGSPAVARHPPPNKCASSSRTECSATCATLRSGASVPMVFKQQLRSSGTRHKHVNRIWGTCRPTVTRPRHFPTETCGRRIPPSAALSSHWVVLAVTERLFVVSSLGGTHPRGNLGTLTQLRLSPNIFAGEHILPMTVPFCCSQTIHTRALARYMNKVSASVSPPACPWFYGRVPGTGGKPPPQFSGHVRAVQKKTPKRAASHN